jgi:hypothetical protein
MWNRLTTGNRLGPFKFRQKTPQGRCSALLFVGPHSFFLRSARFRPYSALCLTQKCRVMIESGDSIGAFD